MAIEGFNYQVELLIGTVPTDISGHSNSVSLTPSRNVDDVTPFGVEWKEKMAGIRDWKGQLKIFYTEDEGEAFDLLWEHYTALTEIGIILTPNGSGSAFTGNVIFGEVSHEASPDGGPIAVTASFEGTGELTYASGPL
jgi:hypothetical protein